MTWHAVQELRPSFEATKRFLLPFSLRRWLALAVIAFFVSGASGANPGSPTTFGSAPREDAATEFSPPADWWPTVSEIDLAVILLLVGAAAALGLVLLFVGAVMEFVFVRVVTERDVRLRGRVSENAGKGLSLLLFRIALVVGLVALFALPAIALFFLSPFLLVAFAIVLVPVFFLVGVALWVVLRFTADFVVPVMVLEDVGILEGWRSFWPALVDEWKQYAVYALARIALGILAGILASIGFVAVAIALAVPFGVVAAGLYLVLAFGAGLQTVAFWALVVVGIVALASLVVAGVTLVHVPIQTYLRYYSLFVLGAITPGFDLVGPHRSAVRDAGGDDGDDRP